MRARATAVLQAVIMALGLSACTTLDYAPCVEGARLLSASASVEDVLEAADDCRSLAGEEAYGLSLRAAVHVRMGDFEQAVADADAALALKPGDAFTLYFRGLAEEQRARTDAAAADFRAAAENGLDAAYALKARGRAKFLTDDILGAFADFDAHVSAHPDDEEGYQLRAVTLIVMERYQAALLDLNTAAALDPEYLGPRSSRAFLLYMMGNYEASVADFRWVLDRKKEGVRTAFYYFAMLRAGVDPDEAMAELKRRTAVLDISRYHGVLPALFTGDIDSEGLVQNVLRTGIHKPFENEAEAYFYPGMKALLAGDKQTARRWFEKVIATGVIRYDEIRASRKELRAMGVEVPPRLPFPPPRLR
jgi:lipoprotein NlpI